MAASGRRTKKRKNNGGFHPPPENRQCAETKKDGTRCQAWTLPGSDRCQFHTQDGWEVRKRAREASIATRARWRAVEEACQRLPLLTPLNQAKYLNSLIEEEDRAGRPDVRLITMLMTQLAKVTEQKTMDLAITVQRVIQPQVAPEAIEVTAEVIPPNQESESDAE